MSSKKPINLDMTQYILYKRRHAMKHKIINTNIEQSETDKTILMSNGSPTPMPPTSPTPVFESIFKFTTNTKT